MAHRVKPEAALLKTNRSWSHSDIDCEGLFMELNRMEEFLAAVLIVLLVNQQTDAKCLRKIVEAAIDATA